MPRTANIWSHNVASEGAKELSVALGVKRLKHKGSKYVPNARKIIINWGDSRNFPEAYNASQVLNSPFVVGAVSNKLRFFELVGGDVRVPEWTVDVAVAREWQAEGLIVVVRNTLTGHSGDGIIIVSDQATQMPRAPLYTKYVPKKDEFRVHFCNGQIIDVQQKRKRLEVPNDQVNYQVRSHANGFVYARENVIVPDDVRTQAEATIRACGLDFGAIDIIYNQKHRQAYVLEVNTAPGLEGQTAVNYANAFKELINQ